MPAGMVAAERVNVRPTAAPVGTPTLVCVRKELETARQIINRLAHTAYDQLDGENMYDLGAAEGLIAGALKKLDGALVQA